MPEAKCGVGQEGCLSDEDCATGHGHNMDDIPNLPNLLFFSTPNSPHAILSSSTICIYFNYFCNVLQSSYSSLLHNLKESTLSYFCLFI